MSGLVAWLLWLAVHLVALTGFKHRIAVLFNWAIAFVGRGTRVLNARSPRSRCSPARSATRKPPPSTAVRPRFARPQGAEVRLRAAAFSTCIATIRRVSHSMRACRASPTIP